MPASWKPEVFVEKKWSANQLRFATKPEAEAYALDLFSRWTMTEDSRAAESDEVPNAQWVVGKGLIHGTPDKAPAQAAE